MTIQSVKVSNVSLSATEQDVQEFFSFSGEIVHVEMHGDNERSQVAYITFKDLQGAETAVLLSGATIVDQMVTIDIAPDFKPPASAIPATDNKDTTDAESAAQKAEDVVSSMLAKGFILGKDAVNRAKIFDEKHQFTSTASATVASLDQKIASLDQKMGLTEKINVGTTIMNEKVKEMDQKYHVSEKTKSALTAAEQTVSNAGSAIMKNYYVLSGATWAIGAFHRVGQKTREKILAEEQAGNAQNNESPKVAEPTTGEQPSNAQINEPESLKAAEPATGEQPSKAQINEPETLKDVEPAIGEQFSNVQINEPESLKAAEPATGEQASAEPTTGH